MPEVDGVDVETLQPIEDVDVEADVPRVGQAPHGVSLTDGEHAALAAQLLPAPDGPS